jgi:hypothetical protein
MVPNFEKGTLPMLQGDLKTRIDELIASTQRAEFYGDAERQAKVQQSEKVKFWEFMRPLVREVEASLEATDYLILAEAANSVVFRLRGSDFTRLNVNFQNQGSLILSISQGLGEQTWTLRPVAVDSFIWGNGTQKRHIEAVAEMALTWFLEITMRQLAEQGVIRR